SRSLRLPPFRRTTLFRSPAGTELAGKRVCVEIDGGRVRLRKVTRKQRGKGKHKKQKRRYKGQWREPKLLTIFEIDGNGQMARKRSEERRVGKEGRSGGWW